MRCALLVVLGRPGEFASNRSAIGGTIDQSDNMYSLTRANEVYTKPRVLRLVCDLNSSVTEAVEAPGQ